MSLKHGLNIKKKAPPAPVRRPVLDDDDLEDDDSAQPQPPPPTRRNGAPPQPPRRKEVSDHGPDLSSLGASQARVKAAEEVDAHIFDYDSFHDAKTHVSDAKKAAERQDAIERKPKYINNLLDAASRRKKDQMIAKEKLLQKEREAEGDEFADKEKFVTGAYKEAQAEARRLEEEEKVKKEEEEARKRKGGGGMQGFYKSMMDQTEAQHREAVEAAERVEREGVKGDKNTAGRKDGAETTAELKAKGVRVNEDGQIVDKRDLLTAGLNVSAKPGSSSGADHLRTSNTKPGSGAFQQRNNASRDAQRERQSRLMEEQLAERQKRARDEEEAERVKIEKEAKSAKTDTDKMDAKARYLARKAAKERGEA